MTTEYYKAEYEEMKGIAENPNHPVRKEIRSLLEDGMVIEMAPERTWPHPDDCGGVEQGFYRYLMDTFNAEYVTVAFSLEMEFSPETFRKKFEFCKSAWGIK